MNTVKQDLVEAKSKHYMFKSKMRAYVDGSKEVSEEILANHNACVLGKWINEVGKPKYGTFSELKELDQTHQRIHNTAKEIIQFKKGGNQPGAEAKLDEIEEIGSRIVDCIERLEGKL